MSNGMLNDMNEEALDFNSLREHGIELIQKMAGKTWTDFNLHDPGVTILEQLCYALTDLAYQTAFDIADLLANEEGTIDYERNSFFIKQQVLTSNPVTIADYRKAIIDEVPEVDNVWLIPVISSNGYPSIRGLYKMAVQVNKTLARQWLAGTLDQNEISGKVRACFSSKRNLCQDIAGNILLLKPVEIEVRAEVQIEPHLVPEQVLAQIYLALEKAINQPVVHLTEKEMENRGYAIDEMYCGPLLKNGLIPDENLKDRRASLDTANIIQSISGIEGVVLVKSLFIQKAGSTEEPVKVLTLSETEFPFFNIEAIASLNINLFVDKYRTPPIRKTIFADLLQKAVENEYRDFVRSFYRSENRLTGLPRKAAPYFSIQHYFPLVYGIGTDGLLSSATEERKAQARQLKAYLMLFEQVLANYRVQLSAIPAFFSNDLKDQDDHTYFTSPLYEVPGAADIFSAYTNGPDGTNETWDAFKTGNAYEQTLRAIVESDTEFDDRKNRVLDHLLARFNEVGVIYPVRLYHLIYRPHQQIGRITPEIRWKAALLKDLSLLNYNRARAFDYLNPGEKGFNFEEKMRRLLYIVNDRKMPLMNAFNSPGLRFGNVTQDVKEQQAAVAHASGETDWTPELQKMSLSVSEIKALMEQQQLLYVNDVDNRAFAFRSQDISMLKYAININNYRVAPDPYREEQYLILYKTPLAEKWSLIYRNEGGREATISKLRNLVNYLTKISTQSEGFYIVEHLLLRPESNSTSFGFRLYKDSQQVVFEHDKLLTSDRREEIISGLLKFRPDEGFYLARQNMEMAAANRALHQEEWKNRVEELVQKARMLQQQAAGLLATAMVQAERAVGEQKVAADKNKSIAELNKLIAMQNLEVATQLQALRDKGKVISGGMLYQKDDREDNTGLRYELNHYHESAKGLHRKAIHQEESAREVSDAVNRDLLGRLSELGKIPDNNVDEYTKLSVLFDCLAAYGQQPYPKLVMMVRAKAHRLVKEDFFSQNMSIVFPEWPARFQEKSFRAFAESLFKYHTPAHIRLHIKWISREKMEQFEPIFLHWRQNLSTGRSSTDARELITLLEDESDKSYLV